MKLALKKFVLLQIICLVWATLPLITSAQETQLTANIEWLTSKIGKVDVDKNSYGQTLEHLEDIATGMLRLIVSKTDSKGKTGTEVYEFHLSDIDKNTVVRRVSGKMLTVNMSTTNQQKLVQLKKEGILQNYVSDIQIVVGDTDVAQEIIDKLKETIPLSSSGQKQWANLTEALDWLAENVGTISLGTTEYVQNFSYDPEQDHKISFSTQEVSSKGKVSHNLYEFYLSDLTENAINFQIQGKELSAKLVTKGSKKYIKYTSNGEVKNYTSNVKIIAHNLELARNIINALRVSVKYYNPGEVSLANAEQGMIWLTDKIGTVESGKGRIIQTVDFNTKSFHTTLNIQKINDKGSTDENQYEFYLYDIDENALNLEVSGTELSTQLRVKARKKYIKTYQNKTLGNYSSVFEIAFSDIRMGRQIISTMKYVLAEISDEAPGWGNLSSAYSWMHENLGSATDGKYQYEQKIEFNEANGNTIYQLTKTDPKGDNVESNYNFYLDEINTSDLNIEVTGSKMFVNIAVNAKKKFVKYTKNGIQQNFVNDFDMYFEDVGKAKDMIAALKYAVPQAEKTISLNTKEEAINWLVENIEKIKITGSAFDQKLEYNTGEVCKVTYTNIESDEKGNNTERIYEFNFGNLNAQLLETKVTGKKMTVDIMTSGKQKLIKNYKDGELQNYGYALEIVVADSRKAKNVISALQFLKKKCE